MAWRRAARTHAALAVIDDKTTDAELDQLAALGFKGVRLNLSTAGINDPKVATERFLAAAARVKSRNWHIQLNTTLPVIAAMKDAFAASPFRWFSITTAMRRRSSGWAGRFLRSGEPGEIRQGLCQDLGHCGPARELRPFHAARPDADRRQRRPHPVGHQLATPEFVDGSTAKVTSLWQVDDGLVLNLLPTWAPDAAVRKKILVDNPARLYEF